MVRVKSKQKFFTEGEVTSLTGICSEHLRNIAKTKHLGTMAVAIIAGQHTESWFFTNSDLLILAVLQPRCEH